MRAEQKKSRRIFFLLCRAAAYFGEAEIVQGESRAKEKPQDSLSSGAEATETGGCFRGGMRLKEKPPVAKNPCERVVSFAFHWQVARVCVCVAGLCRNGKFVREGVAAFPCPLPLPLHFQSLRLKSQSLRLKNLCGGLKDRAGCCINIKVRAKVGQ